MSSYLFVQLTTSINCTVKKAECQRINAFKRILEKTPESPLDSTEIKPVNPKGNPPWIFIGRMDAEAETPIFWSPDVNSWLIEKAPDAGKHWGQKKRASEDGMAGWHHSCSEPELGQTLGDSEGQEGLACCSPWGRKELGMTGWPNNSNNVSTLD